MPRILIPLVSSRAIIVFFVTMPASCLQRSSMNPLLILTYSFCCLGAVSSRDERRSVLPSVPLQLEPKYRTQTLCYCYSATTKPLVYHLSSSVFYIGNLLMTQRISLTRVREPNFTLHNFTFAVSHSCSL